MSFRGLFKDISMGRQLFIFTSFIVLGVIFSQYFFYVFLWMKTGFSKEITDELILQINENADLLRQLLFFQSVCAFIFPSLIMAYLFGTNTASYLHADSPFSGKTGLLTVLSIVLALPMINCLAYWNQQVELPESMGGVETLIRNMEDQAQEIFDKLLFTDSFITFLYNFLIVALLAAIGEEFLFRGVLKNIFSRKMKNHHLIIWITAIIFSLVHFQFYGFFPRMFLGAYLGYLLYYTQSVWVPVLAHLTNNAIGVIGYYKFYNTEEARALDAFGTGSTYWAAILSFILFSLTFYFLIRTCRNEREE